MPKEYFYKLKRKHDPTNIRWRRAKGEDIGYRYVKNKGIYTNKPITDMCFMFQDTYITEFDATNWDLSSVTNMIYMFTGTTSLKSVSLPDTSNVTDMRFMFSHTTSLTSVSLPDTSNVTNMLGMFYAATSIKSVSIADTSSVTDMRYMFKGAASLIEDIRDWDVSKVTDQGMQTGFANMFYRADEMQEKFSVGHTPTRGWFNKREVTKDD